MENTTPNAYKQKLCSVCNKEFRAYRGQKYCSPSCSRVGKNEVSRAEYNRKKDDPEYIQKRRQSYYNHRQTSGFKKTRQAWIENNRDKLSRYGLKYYYADPVRAKEKREKAKLKQWGLSIDDYERLVKAQGGGCAICKKPCSSGRKLAVDHDHKTGRIRGLLCSNCNLGLGKFFDNKELLRKAISYL